MRIRATVGLLACVALAPLSIGVAGASAYRTPLVQAGSEKGEEDWLSHSELLLLPEETEHQIEGACGLAASSTEGALFVADYYHRAIVRFTLGGGFTGFQSLAGGDPLLLENGINELNAVCGLAADGAGNLYGAEFHGRVLRLQHGGAAGEAPIDPGPATGIAVDAAGDLYVDRRTYVAVYEAPVDPGDEPAARIGQGGALRSAYGVAVDAASKRVYVPDAASGTIKVFEPAISPSTPVATIAGPPEIGFRSLVDAVAAVDDSKTEGEGHLLVVDDLKPGSELPEAAVYEFGAGGEYLGRLRTRTVGPVGVKKEDGPTFGEPSGIAVDPGSGEVYVTTGNSAFANVVKYGPFEATAAPSPPAPPSEAAGPISPGQAGPLAAQATPRSSARRPPPPASASVVVQRGPVRVSVNGKLTPRSLPRHGTAPVGIAVDAHIAGTGKGTPPQLRRIAIEINRNGHLNARGLPVCDEGQIQPATTAAARAACAAALVGEGHFAANVRLPEQSPFPSSGKVLAFNGRLHGKPAILAHIYGTQPAPTSFVLPFAIRGSRGAYGTLLEASLPRATGNWGYVTGLRMTLHRSFRYRGGRHSYLSAGCPAPAGFSGAVFPLARTSFAFAGGMELTSVLSRNCKAKG